MLNVYNKLYIIWGGCMENIININKLTFRYNDRFIFDKFSLNIQKGKWITISGPNGSGKSTLVKILSGLEKTSSDISIDELSLNETNIYEIRKKIGIVFDNLDNTFICETIEDDIAFTLENLNYSRMQIHSRINTLTKLLDINKILDKSSLELSGGEKFKAALACALSHNPKILIIDQSLSYVDRDSKLKILNLLKELKEKENITIINITNDLSESYLSDRLIIINDGTIILDGKPLQVMEYDKILNKLGVELPFEMELSIKLKLYGLIDKPISNIEEMVDELWE